MEFLIRQGFLDDVEGISKVFNDYRVFYKQKSDLVQAKEFIAERLENNESVIFIAESQESKVLGFLQMYFSLSSVSVQRTIIINDLYVVEESRKSGVSNALMKAAHEYALKVGINLLTLETQSDNYTAKKLYENLGYKKTLGMEQYFLKV